jgi:hypothetical protein
MIKLKSDLGAVEGQPADAKLREAIDKVADEGTHATVLFDGQFKFKERSDFSFLGRKGKHLILKGDGATSIILPEIHPTVQGLHFTNLEQLVIEDLAIVGNPNVLYDCGLFIYCGGVRQVIWNRTHVYGLASDNVNPNGIIYMEDCGLSLKDSLFDGSTARDSSIFTLRRMETVTGENVNFVDYGDIQGGGGKYGTYHSKTNEGGFSKAWIRFVDQKGEAYAGIPKFSGCFFDEGAYYGIAVDAPVGAPMKGLRIKDSRVNIRTAGYSANNLESLIFEDCKFTYRDDVPALVGNNVKRTRFVRSFSERQNTDIVLKGNTKSIVMEDSYGFNKVIVPEGTVFTTIRDGLVQ